MKRPSSPAGDSALCELTDEDVLLLTSFRDLQSSEAELIEGLHGLLEIDFEPMQRRLNSHHAFLEPGIPVTSVHISWLNQKLADGSMTRSSAERWSALILLYDVFDLAGPDEEVVAERLHEFAMLPQTAA